MTVAAGTKLGPYEVLDQIGAGGMGEVYRAKDPRLGREVAIKVLPAFFDPDRLRRFEREAQAAGSLNHPNITAVHDIGTHEGAPYVVMELLKGETLRERLASGAIPVRKAIDYAIQIARGLAAAHEASIIHRDLKPENLFVMSDGRVKILDFGLAKLTQTEGGSDMTEGTTATQNTEPGVVMGTVGYMSPEQVKGLPADARSDIFSLGVVLYEMLSGKRAFKRDSPIETMSAILKEDPPELSATNKTVAPGLERVVRRCLEKNPEERTHSAADLAFQLETLSTLSGSTTPLEAARSRRRKVLPLLAGGALVLAAAAGFLAYTVGRRASAPAPPSVLQVTFRRGTVASARFAPDGETIVYTAAWDGKPMEIFVGSTKNADARPFGLVGAEALAISSTGELALSLDRAKSGEPGTLARVPIGGGVAPREILEDVNWADWAPNGRELAVVFGGRLEYPAGKLLHETKDGWLSYPRISPEGDRVAFFDHPMDGDDTGTLVIAHRDGKKIRSTRSFISTQGIAWAPSGEVWFGAEEPGSSSWGTTGRALYRMGSDGQAQLIWRIVGSIALQDISRHGRLLITREAKRSEMWALAPGESRERDLTWMDGSHSPILSPDGTKLVFTGPPREFGVAPGPVGDPFNYFRVFMRATDGSPPVLLGPGGAVGLSPGGQWALAATTLKPEFTVYPTRAGASKRIALDGFENPVASSFLDDEHFLFTANEKGKAHRVFVASIDGAAPRALTPEGFWSGQRLSGDRKWLLVMAEADQKAMLYPTAGGEPKAIVGLVKGDLIAGLGPDDRFLYIRKGRGLPIRMFRHDVKTGRQEPWREIMPTDPAGIATAGIVKAPIGDAYVYTCSRDLSDLYVVDGLR